MRNTNFGRRRSRKQLHGASCSTWPRLARGAIGGVVGLIGGGLLGWLGSVAIMPTSSHDATASRGKAMMLVSAGTTIVGVGVGAYVGARKPDC